MLEKEDIIRLKEIFMTKDSCNQIINDTLHETEKESIRIAVIESQLKIIIWVLSAVCGGIITMIIKMFFGS